MVKIEDERAALDFDLACTTRLVFYDLEKEKQQLEAMSLGAVSGLTGPPQVQIDRSAAQKW